MPQSPVRYLDNGNRYLSWTVTCAELERIYQALPEPRSRTIAQVRDANHRGCYARGHGSVRAAYRAAMLTGSRRGDPVTITTTPSQLAALRAHVPPAIGALIVCEGTPTARSVAHRREARQPPRIDR